MKKIIERIKWWPTKGGIGIMVFISLILAAHIFGTWAGVNYAKWRYRLDMIPTIQKTKQVTDDIKAQVVLYILQEAPKYGVEVDDALRIIKCESGFNPYAEARDIFGEGSTAKGAAQFIDATWKRVGRGDVFDYKANITAFLSYWPKHRSEWACK